MERPNGWRLHNNLRPSLFFLLVGPFFFLKYYYYTLGSASIWQRRCPSPLAAEKNLLEQTISCWTKELETTRFYDKGVNQLQVAHLLCLIPPVLFRPSNRFPEEFLPVLRFDWLQPQVNSSSVVFAGWRNHLLLAFPPGVRNKVYQRLLATATGLSDSASRWPARNGRPMWSSWPAYFLP